MNTYILTSSFQAYKEFIKNFPEYKQEAVYVNDFKKLLALERGKENTRVLFTPGFFSEYVYDICLHRDFDILNMNLRD